MEVSQFAKDHWSVLMYLEALVVDFSGKVRHDDRHMREPQMSEQGWKYGTILQDGSVVDGHGDWECLFDLVDNGYVEVLEDDEPDDEWTRFGLTELGWMTTAVLRRRKAEGLPMSDYTGEL